MKTNKKKKRKRERQREREKQLQKYVTNIINLTLHFLAVQIDNEYVQSNNSTSKQKIQEKTK